MRFFTSSTPRWRAVWNPKVSMWAGRSRSLSMVLGTCTTRRSPPASSESFIDENAVSSPPMVISMLMPSLRIASRAACMCRESLVGLAREIPRREPPRKWSRLTFSIVSGMVASGAPRMMRSKPSRIPTTSTPPSSPRMVAAPMTLLMPGAGPPPTRIPSLPVDAMAAPYPTRHAMWRSPLESHPLSNVPGRRRAVRQHRVVERAHGGIVAVLLLPRSAQVVQLQISDVVLRELRRGELRALPLADRLTLLLEALVHHQRHRLLLG